MTLTFAAALASAGIDPTEALVIRHSYVREHEDGTVGIHGDSSNDEIMTYTSGQSANPRIFAATPPKFWIVFSPRAVIVLGCGRSSPIAARSGTGTTAWDGPSISNTPT